MSGDKDLIIHDYSGGVNTSPLVRPASKLDEEMYSQIVRLNKTVKVIQKILEECNEK